MEGRLQFLRMKVEESLFDNIQTSVTTDIWSSPSGNSYISFTMHLITPLFVTKTYSLGAVPIGAAAHTAATISDKL